MNPVLPRFAAYCASSGDNPFSCCSRASSSRSERSSRSRSASRSFLRRHRILGLLRPHDLGHSSRHLPPPGFFLEELLSSGNREPVILEFPVAVRRRFPLRGNPAFFLKPMQGRIQRAVLDLKDIVRCLLYMLSDLMTVRRAEE